MKSKIIIGIVASVAVLGGGYTVSRMDFIGTGKVGIVYNYKDGVQDTVLTPGMHFIAPMNKVKEFSTSNEILVLTKDKRDGSKEDESFNLQAEATKQQEFIKTSIDDTLSISGKAADAAVTGKKIDSLKEDLSNKITKFYASNEGKNHLADSDNGKIEDMVLYGKSEQKQYKGINLLPPDTNFKEYVEVSIPKGSLVFWVTDGILTNGGNFRFFNEDKTESMWFGIDSNTTSKRMSLTIDAKYVQNLISTDFDLSKICLGVGSKPIYEPYTGGIPSPSPDYPQKIKNVVNPTVKVCGKNLWNPTLGGYISGSDGSIKAAPKKVWPQQIL